MCVQRGERFTHAANVLRTSQYMNVCVCRNSSHKDDKCVCHFQHVQNAGRLFQHHDLAINKNSYDMFVYIRSNQLNTYKDTRTIRLVNEQQPNIETFIYLCNFRAGCDVLGQVDNVHFLVEHGRIVVDVVDVDDNVDDGRQVGGWPKFLCQYLMIKENHFEHEVLCLRRQKEQKKFIERAYSPEIAPTGDFRSLASDCRARR